jgi:hypothetical protein
MNATINEARLSGIGRTTQVVESSEHVAHVQNAFLSELPGVVFGLLTLAYIAGSFYSLL